MFIFAGPQGSFIAPNVWEIVGRKIYQISKIATILDSRNDFLQFSENRDKEFKLASVYSNFLVLGTTPPAVH